MVKRNLPKHVYLKGRKKYPYFVRGNTCQRIHSEPGTNAFWAEYSAILNGRHTYEPKRTVKKLIARYMQSQKWDKLADNTKKSYIRSMRYFEDRMGMVDPAAIRRRHVIEMRDALSATPTTANRRVGALSVLLEYAIDIGWLDRNHAKGVASLETKKQRQPWPAEMIDAFRQEASGKTLLIFELLLGTGQRIGDVLSMQWGHIEDGGIFVRQGKTKAELWIPFTKRLQSVLDDTPKSGLFIVNIDGRKIAYNTAWKWLTDIRKQIGAMDYDLHSIRHTTASELAALGLDDQHIMAITGHSSGGMVRLYAGRAAQKARAKKAQAERNKNKT